MEKPTLEQRFWAKVAKRGTDDCWEWTASVYTETGYGHFGIEGGKTDAAHRVSYRLSKGEIPRGMFVCHSCDNRKCVNPGHLWLGTQHQNNSDMKAKGRARGPNFRGSKIGTSKLKEEQVIEIKAALKAGARPADLGRKFNVTSQAISRIKRGLNWFHLQG